IQGAVSTTVGSQKLKVKVTTDYPWDGKVALDVAPDSPAKFELRLRVPDWCEGATVSVKGQKVSSPHMERGYIVLSREWHKGDAVKLDLPMPVRRVIANPAVKSDHSLLAIQRGPLVYCLEGCDQNEPISSLYLPASAELKAEMAPRTLGGIVLV